MAMLAMKLVMQLLSRSENQRGLAALGQSTGAQQLESQETGTPARSQYEPLQRHEDIFLAFHGVQVWFESSTKQPAKKAAQHVLLQPRPVPAMRG
jgi:hypothetical protein